MGGKILVVFMVERRTTKYLPMKQYCIVPGCGLVYRDHKTGQKFTAHEKYLPYVVYVHTLLSVKGTV